MAIYETQTATVYKAAGKRFLTKKAAIRHAAKATVNAALKRLDRVRAHGFDNLGFPLFDWDVKDEERYQRAVNFMERLYRRACQPNPKDTTAGEVGL